MNLINRVFRCFGRRLAEYLTEPLESYQIFDLLDEQTLLSCLKPGDILLVEGNSRISTAIKYLTQSTWSHACIYLGDDAQKPLVEADLIEGIIRIPLSKYIDRNTRICRPVGLKDQDLDALTAFVLERMGHTYDLKNIFDLLRYLIQKPPVPDRYRRSLIEFGSGDPTKAICSTLIAQAFQHIRYPILPREVSIYTGRYGSETDERMLEARHHSHFTPRDFDLSPYFAVVKPTLEGGFDYSRIRWLDESRHIINDPDQGSFCNDKTP